MRITLFFLLILFVNTVLGQEKTTKDIIDFPDVEAEFPGGHGRMSRFIGTNVIYPAKALKKNKQGKVFVSFIVEKDGSLTNIRVEKKAYKLLNKEAIRVVQMMPKWKPGEAKGKKVRTKCILPINFSLE